MRPASPLPATADERDVVRLGHLARGRRGASGASLRRRCRRRACGGRGRRRRGGCARPRRRGGRGRPGGRGRAGLDHRQHVADLHVGALRCLICASTPACSAPTSRSIFSVSSSTTGSPAATASPSLLQPARDARFDDRFTELGNDDVAWPRNPLDDLRARRARVSALSTGHVQRERLVDDDALMRAGAAPPSLRTGWRCAAGRRSAPAAGRRAAPRARGAAKVHAPMFCGSSCTHTTSCRLGIAGDDRARRRRPGRGRAARRGRWRRPASPRARSLDTRST